MSQPSQLSDSQIANLFDKVHEIDQFIATIINSGLTDQLNILLSAKRSLCEALFHAATNAIQRLSPHEAAALMASLRDIFAFQEALTDRLREATSIVAANIASVHKGRAVLNYYPTSPGGPPARSESHPPAALAA